MENHQGRLAGRTALVTGAGRGIGREVALGLAREGARVVVASRSSNEIDDVAAAIIGDGGKALAIRIDVADPQSVRTGFEVAREAFDHIDILVSNAGIGRSALLWRTDDELWNSTIATNLSGTFYCMREVLGPMVERKWGRVINVASVAGKVGSPYVSAYTASKHAVLGLTKSAALEVARHSVTVNAVCPGYVDTPMTDGAIQTIIDKTGMSSAEARKHLESFNPQGRLVTSEEVAFLVVSLTFEEARGINGQAISIDGGSVTS